MSISLVFALQFERFDVFLLWRCMGKLRSPLWRGQLAHSCTLIKMNLRNFTIQRSSLYGISRMGGGPGSIVGGTFLHLRKKKFRIFSNSKIFKKCLKINETFIIFWKCFRKFCYFLKKFLKFIEIFAKILEMWICKGFG